MEIFRLFGSIFINTDAASQSISATTEKAQSFSEKLSGGFKTVGENATKLGAKMSLGITTPLTLLGKKAIDTAADFEYSMSEVGAISGATGEDFAALRAKAEEMGRSTKFSASESAEALKYMAMAGWDTSDMLDGLEGVLNLAAASGEDLGTTSDIVTDALTALGLSASDSGHFADVLATAASSANTDVGKMGETFKYVAPIAGTFGYTAEDLSLAIGLMGNASIKSSQAGTTLRSSLTRLSGTNEAVMDTMVSLGLATAETAQVLDNGKIQNAQEKVANKTIDMEKAQIKYNEAVNKYGAESSQAQTAALNLEKSQNNLQSALNDLETAYQGNIEVQGYNNALMFKSDGTSRSLRDVIIDLREKFSTLSEEEQVNAAAVLFGQEAMSGMLAVINASDEDFNNLVNALDNADGAAKEMAATMSDNLKGRLTELNSQVEGLMIQFVDLVMPYLKQGVEWLSKVCDWIAGLDENTQKMILTIGGVLAAAGPLLILFGRVSSGIGSIIQVGGSLIGGIGKVTGGIGGLIGKVSGGSGLLSAFMAIPTPVKVVIGIFAALVAAGVLIYKNWDEIKEWAGKTWEKIKGIVGGAVDGIRNFFSGIIDFVKDNWQGLALLLVNPFVGGFKLLYDNCETFRNFVDNFLGNLKEGFQNFASNISEKAGELKDKVVTKAKELKDGTVEKFSELQDKATEKIENLREKVTGKVEQLKESAGEKITSLKEKAVSKFNELRESATEKIESLRESATNKFEQLKVSASEKVSSLKESAVSRFQELKQSATEKIDSLKEKGIEGFEALRSGALKKFDDLKTGVSEKLNGVKDFVSNTVQKLKDFFKFDWSLPKIKLPHFRMEGNFSLNPPSIPRFGVEWYKKAMDNPVIMEKPTAFGINSSGQIMAGGEAGSEVVSGTQTLMSMISAAVAENNEKLNALLNQIYDLLAQYIPDLASRQLLLDTGALVGELAEPMNEELGRITYMRGRRN